MATWTRLLDLPSIRGINACLANRSILREVSVDFADGAAERDALERLMTEAHHRDAAPGQGSSHPTDEKEIQSAIVRLAKTTLACHPHFSSIVRGTFENPSPARFSAIDFAAWYSAADFETAKAEIAFHLTERARDEGSFPYKIEYTFFSCCLRGSYVDLRDITRAGKALDPRPSSYFTSQHFARQVRGEGATGIVYPSIRHRGGTCYATFKDQAITNVRWAETSCCHIGEHGHHEWTQVGKR